MKSLWSALIQRGWCLTKRGHLDTRKHAPREEKVRNQGENSHLQAKERDLEDILTSQPSKGSSPPGTLLWTSSLQNHETQSSVAKPLSLWPFVTETQKANKPIIS